MRVIDPPVQRLVGALNAFDGIETIGSCGGHPAPLRGGQWAAGSWYVKFRVDKNAHGWRALEFLAWLVNNSYQRNNHHVTLLYPIAPPPFLNTPGEVLAFALEGYDGEGPDALADWMVECWENAYIPPRGRRPSSNEAASTRRARRTVVAGGSS